MVTCWCLHHATRSTPHDIHLNAKTCRHPFPSRHSVTNQHRIHKHSLQLYFPSDESPTDNYLSQNVDPRRLNKKELGFLNSQPNFNNWLYLWTFFHLCPIFCLCVATNSPSIVRFSVSVTSAFLISLKFCASVDKPNPVLLYYNALSLRPWSKSSNCIKTPRLERNSHYQDRTSIRFL